MELDFTKYENNYVELPCNVVDTPDSFVYPVVKALVDNSLDYLIRQQSDDGAWRLTWRLGDGDAFEQLQKKYEAHFTMLILAELGRFGRV